MSLKNVGFQLARSERAGLAADLLRLGPDAPTLCAGWLTRDLAAHLVLRESRPDASAGVMGGPVSKWTERVQKRISAQDYTHVVERFRSGPPTMSVFALPGIDGAANAIEYLVHHEDILRSQPNWQPREFATEVKDFIWKRLTSPATKLMLRSAKQGVTLHRRDVPGAIDATPGAQASNVFTVKTGPDAVVLTGDPIELLMCCFGRRAVQVDITGTASAVSKFDLR